MIKKRVKATKTLNQKIYKSIKTNRINNFNKVILKLRVRYPKLKTRDSLTYKGYNNYRRTLC
jgi:hypothetical protein